MNRVRRVLSSWRITGLGWVFVAIVPAAFLLAALGPSDLRTPALIVGVLVLFVIVSEGAGSARFGGGRFGGLAGGSQRERRERLSGLGTGAPPISESVEADESAWQRERERREREASE
jgi:hypothetical protein